jgi:hypothetical protein
MAEEHTSISAGPTGTADPASTGDVTFTGIPPGPGGSTGPASTAATQ